MKILDRAGDLLRRVADALEPNREPAPTANAPTATPMRLDLGLIPVEARKAGVYERGEPQTLPIQHDRLAAPVAYNNSTAMPRVEAGALPYGPSPSNRGNGPD